MLYLVSKTVQSRYPESFCETKTPRVFSEKALIASESSFYNFSKGILARSLLTRFCNSCAASAIFF